MMDRTRFVFLSLVLLFPGCASFEQQVARHFPGLNRRREPDLLILSPEEEARFRRPAALASYPARITDRGSWQIHTTLDNRAALIDGDPLTIGRSTPGRPCQWILLDLGEECCFQQVLQHHGGKGGHPGRYRIDVADGRGFPYQLMYLGSGSPEISIAILERPVAARFLRITILEGGSEPWSVAELTIE